MILALDPGNEQTGYVVFNEDTRGVFTSGVKPNDMILDLIAEWSAENCSCAIEMIASYGMPVGAEVFDTCVWIGRFVQQWTRCNEWKLNHAAPVKLVYRKDVKMHLCGQTKAKDSNIWQALLDKFGPVGTKKQPGSLYGVRSHARAALAVAVTFAEAP